MGTKPTSKDLFLNFVGIKGKFEADAADVGEQFISTGLSIRGALGWLIHDIQFWLWNVRLTHEDNCNAALILSTRKGLAVAPLPVDDGVVDAIDYVVGQGSIAAGAGAALMSGSPHHFAPPIPLAAASLSLYTQAAGTYAGWNNADVYCRIGYTTVPMDGAMWQEVAEAWAW